MKNKINNKIKLTEILPEALITLMIGVLILPKFFRFFRKRRVYHPEIRNKYYTTVLNNTLNKRSFNNFATHHRSDVALNLYEVRNPDTYYNSESLIKVRLTELAIIKLAQRFNAILFTKLLQENPPNPISMLLGTQERTLASTNFMRFFWDLYNNTEGPLDLRGYIINTEFINLEAVEPKNFRTLNMRNNTANYLFKFPFETLESEINDSTNFNFIKTVKLNHLKVQSTIFQHYDINLCKNRELTSDLRRELKFMFNNLLYSNMGGGCYYTLNQIFNEFTEEKVYRLNPDLERKQELIKVKLGEIMKTLTDTYNILNIFETIEHQSKSFKDIYSNDIEILLLNLDFNLSLYNIDNSNIDSQNGLHCTINKLDNNINNLIKFKEHLRMNANKVYLNYKDFLINYKSKKGLTTHHSISNDLNVKLYEFGDELWREEREFLNYILQANHLDLEQVINIHEDFNIALLNKYFMMFEKELIKFDFYIHKCYYARAIYKYKKKLVTDDLRPTPGSGNNIVYAASINNDFSSNAALEGSINQEHSGQISEKIEPPIPNNNGSDDIARPTSSNENLETVLSNSTTGLNTEKGSLQKLNNKIYFNIALKILRNLFEKKHFDILDPTNQLEGDINCGDAVATYLVSEQALGYKTLGPGNPRSCGRPALGPEFFTSLANNMASSSQPVRSIKNIPKVVELSAKTTKASTPQSVLAQNKTWVEEAPVLQRLEEPVLKTGESLIKNWEAGFASHRLSDADIYLDSPSCHTEDFPSPPNHTISEDVLIARAIERDFPSPPNHTVSGAGVLVPPIEAKFDNNSSLGSISLQLQAFDQNALYNIISNSVSSYITYSDIKNPGEGKLKSLNSDYFGVIDNYQNFIISFDNQLIVLIGSPITLMLYCIEYIATLASISLGFTLLSALFKPILNSLSEELKVSVAPVKDGVLGALSLYSDLFLIVSLIKAFIHADLWFGMRIGFLVGIKHRVNFIAIYSFVFKDTDGALVLQYSQYKKENVKELTHLYNIGLD